MSVIIEWLSKYNAEYDTNTKVLYIRKSMSVYEFVFLKKILTKFQERVSDIIIEARD